MTVQLLYSNMNVLVEELIMMSFDWSFNSHYCCDCWLSVYYNWTKQILILQKVSKLTLYQIMKYFYYVIIVYCWKIK